MDRKKKGKDMKEKRRCLASKLGSFPDKKDQKKQERRSKEWRRKDRVL
jgi:hypothetical protein